MLNELVIVGVIAGTIFLLIGVNTISLIIIIKSKRKRKQQTEAQLKQFNQKIRNESAQVSSTDSQLFL
jgi:hypothetical protein